MSGWLSSKSLQITKVGEDVEKRDPLYTVGGNVNWCSHYGKVWTLRKKIKIELPYDSAVPLLDLYPKKMKTQFEKIHVPPFS